MCGGIINEAIYDARENADNAKGFLKAGFVLSASGNSYYHPKHWEEAAAGAGDAWYYEDDFKALTKRAKDFDDGLVLFRVVDEHALAPLREVKEE